MNNAYDVIRCDDKHYFKIRLNSSRNYFYGHFNKVIHDKFRKIKEQMQGM